MQLYSFKQFSVSRNLTACGKDHDISHHDVALGHHLRMTIANNLYGFIIVDLIENGKFAVGFYFKNKSQAGGKEDGYENTYRFKENRSILVKTKILVAGNANGEDTCNEKNNNEGVGELAEKLLPKRFPFRGCQKVDTILLSVLQYLRL